MFRSQKARQPNQCVLVLAKSTGTREPCLEAPSPELWVKKTAKQVAEGAVRLRQAKSIDLPTQRARTAQLLPEVGNLAIVSLASMVQSHGDRSRQTGMAKHEPNLTIRRESCLVRVYFHLNRAHYAISIG